MQAAVMKLILKKTSRNPIYTDGYIKDFKWQMLQPWFRAHDIGQTDSNYVQSAKYSERG